MKRFIIILFIIISGIAMFLTVRYKYNVMRKVFYAYNIHYINTLYDDMYMYINDNNNGNQERTHYCIRTDDLQSYIRTKISSTLCDQAMMDCSNIYIRKPHNNITAPYGLIAYAMNGNKCVIIMCTGEMVKTNTESITASSDYITIKSIFEDD